MLGLADFGLWATALAVASFFQMLLDVTVEETLTKIGFRYVVQEDWGRLRRLFARCVQLKLAGGLLAGVLVAALAPLADTIFDADDLLWPVLVSALLPRRRARSRRRARASCCAGATTFAARTSRSRGDPPRRHRRRRAVRRHRAPWWGSSSRRSWRA